MRYPFIKQNDNTEIVFSETKPDGDVLVFFERWDDDIENFDSMTISLKDQKEYNVVGFSNDEVKEKKEFVLNMTPLIFRFSKQGGIGERAEDIFNKRL